MFMRETIGCKVIAFSVFIWKNGVQSMSQISSLCTISTKADGDSNESPLPIYNQRDVYLRGPLAGSKIASGAMAAENTRGGLTWL